MRILKYQLYEHGIGYYIFFKYQIFWEKVFNMSLRCMNIGKGGDVNTSGEYIALEYVKKRIFRSESPVLFDVGANVGSYTRELSKLCKKGQVHSFEPGCETYKALCDNIKLKNVKLNNIGLSDVCSEVTLYYDNAKSGLASLYKRQLDHFGTDFSKYETVKVDTIDHYCEENKISFIDFLKLDIEGNELKALIGANNMLSNDRVGAIQIEFGGCNIDSRVFFRDFWNLLHEKYLVYRITGGGLFPVTNYAEMLEIFSCTNYLFVHKKHKR